MKPIIFAALPLMPGAALAMQAPPSPSAGMTMQAFVSRQEQRIMADDSDGDGRISQAEFAANARGKGDPARRFARINANHDGYLDKGEIDAMAANHFRRLDSDGDGVLSPTERMAARQARRPQAPAGQ